MNRTLTYQIDPSNTGKTVGQFLKEHGISHPILVHLKKTPESILVNGKWVYVNTRLMLNDELTIHIIEEVPSENITPSEISYEAFCSMIVYEDADILLINKPAGMPVHPSMGHHEETLANYCAYYYQNYAKDEGAFVFRCVNRLDRDTSGLVLIAKNMLSSAILSTSQLERGIHRTYLAICAGLVPDNGVINMPIARKADSVIERCVDYENGECAITNFERLEYIQSDDSFSLVKIQLETGRTHQIRVHMKAIGHPLPGDFLYNPDMRYIKRQALHSYSLEFVHPITREQMHFQEKAPADFYFLPWKYFS